MNVLTYYHTVKHLRIKQMYYQIKYRISKRHKQKTDRVTILKKSGSPLQLIKWITKDISLLSDRTFLFLNIEAPFYNWNDERNSKLWIYNLNYMDYLLQPGISITEASR